MNGDRNLKCLWHFGSSQIKEVSQQTFAELGINLVDQDEWNYNHQGQFTIGQSVRVSEDGELLEGPIFVFNSENTDHDYKCALIVGEITTSKALIVA